MKPIRQSIGLLVAGILLFYLVEPFLQTHTHLKTVTFAIQGGWFFASFLLILVYWSIYLYPFAMVLNSFTEKQVAFWDAFTLFHLSNITRYLPGRIWGVVRLLSLSGQFGLSKTATASSLTLHVGIETVLGGLIAMSLIFSHRMRQTATDVLGTLSEKNIVLFMIAVIGVLTGFVFLIPRLTEHTRQIMKTLIFRVKNPRLWVNVLLSHSLLWFCQGLAFFFFVRSFAPLPWRDAGILTACFAFAWIVGFLSFLTPGGLGIREGLLGLLLSNSMMSPQATFVALICRLWMLSAEIFLACVAFGLHRKRNKQCQETT